MTARIGTLADGTCLLSKELDYRQLLLEFNLILLNAFSNNPHSSDSFLREVHPRGWCFITKYVSSWLVSFYRPGLDEGNLYHGGHSGGRIHRRYSLRK